MAGTLIWMPGAPGKRSLRVPSAQVPASVTVKGLPESGFFLDFPTWDGVDYMSGIYRYAVQMQRVIPNTNADCVAAYTAAEQWKCFLPQYILPFMRTPYFVVNSFYDKWQVRRRFGFARRGPCQTPTPPLTTASDFHVSRFGTTCPRPPAV